jgi:hypothetical protein
MQAASYISGFPRRMGTHLAGLFARDGFAKHQAKVSLMLEVQGAVEQLPLTADEDAIYNAADRASRDCYARIERVMTSDAALLAVGIICRSWGVPTPTGDTAREIMAKAVDRRWWSRQIRKAHLRRLEHVSIQAGTTGLRTDPYISREVAIKQARQNRANALSLENTTLHNAELNQDFKLSELAAKGTGNKAIRRGELMTRIRGFEEIANELGHIGMFWTITCPSKFHSVGGTNPKYNGATPRQAQRYLCKVWSYMRAQFAREGIRPYGFRIAEPHTDGCPHWHMLFFVEPAHADRMAWIIKRHALYEDFGEWEKEDNRAKLINIEAGKGTAAGYIAKYVSKNIDGAGVGDHQAFEDGTTYVIARDVFGNEEITASQRVTYWSQVWGIRQFQQIGGAPVGLWRELRRINEETIQGAPEEVRKAWEATNKKVAEDSVLQASFADFIRAYGGVGLGRDGLVKLAKRLVVIDGRYATYEAEKPCGVYAASRCDRIYESVRYTWTPVEKKEAVALPWTGVNNCTQFDYPDLQQRFNDATSRLSEATKNQKFSAPAWVDWPEVRRTAKEIEQGTNKFAWRRNQHG